MIDKQKQDDNPARIFVEGDIATIMGVKYKKIEEKPTEHPLTNKIIREELITREESNRRLDYGRANYYEEDFRTGADWQLEKDVISVEALLWVVCSNVYPSFEELDFRVKHYLDMFKEGMRPHEYN